METSSKPAASSWRTYSPSSSAPRSQTPIVFAFANFVVPIQIGLIPVAQLYNRLGLFGTLPGVWLYHIAFGLPFAVFLLRNFFIGIPNELLEAARMDGCSMFRTLRSRSRAAWRALTMPIMA